MDFGTLLIAGGVGAVALMQGMILAKLSAFEKVETRVVVLETWACGAKGNNGANGDIAALQAIVDRRSGEDRRATA